MGKNKAHNRKKRGVFLRQARLRAQLGDKSKYSGERRRRSVVEVSMVLTITDPLRGSYLFVQSPSCAHSLLRSFIRLHGVNHNQPFPTATSLHKIFTSFTIFIVFQCIQPITSLPRKFKPNKNQPYLIH